MIFSVFNHGSRSYDYYDDGKPGATHAGAPPLLTLGGIGETPEGAAWRVPMGAKKIGSGDMPKGRVASLGGDPGSGLPRLGIMAGLAYLAWRAFR